MYPSFLFFKRFSIPPFYLLGGLSSCFLGGFVLIVFRGFVFIVFEKIRGFVSLPLTRFILWRGFSCDEVYPVTRFILWRGLSSDEVYPLTRFIFVSFRRFVIPSSDEGLSSYLLRGFVSLPLTRVCIPSSYLLRGFVSLPLTRFILVSFKRVCIPSS